MATYTSILGLQNTWGVGETAGTTWFAGVANTAETLLASFAEVDLSGNVDVTPDAATTARGNVLKLIGTLTGNVNLILPAWAGKQWTIWNATSGAFSVTVKTAAGSGVAVTQGNRADLVCDGTDILRTAPGIPATPPTYTATNVTPDRTFDADAVAVAELADIVGTLIADLKKTGLLQ